MKIRKYYLAFNSDELVASFDAYEDNIKLKEFVNICRTGGYTLKEVSEFEYIREQKIAEERDIERLLK